ncbi:MAG: RidA family protein [Gemmatimonadota bacterium]
MIVRRHDPAGVAPSIGGYTHGLDLPAGARLIFVSGQIPVAPDGSVPADFASQCNAVWDNIGAVLASADMKIDNLVKITTYLTDRSQADVNGRIRRERLGDHRPALTVVVVQTLESQWLLEIEAVAAA